MQHGKSTKYREGNVHTANMLCFLLGSKKVWGLPAPADVSRMPMMNIASIFVKEASPLMIVHL